MIKNKITDAYFEWMYQLVCGTQPSYRKLLGYLHQREFTYVLSMDGNRAEDGIDLRYRFGYEHNIRESVITAYMNEKPCSILEMMVALAIRCEEHIMDNPDIGDRTRQWIWNMLVNLGLDKTTDSDFDERHVAQILKKFLNRKYKKNGEGGLFVIRNNQIDMRSVEIWYQAMWYLDEVLKI